MEKQDKKLPLVSVVIPVYNMERYLSETLESVLKSTYPNLEVVIVDDGSTDNSYGIASDYAQKESRIRCFKQANGGVSHARNTAISYALGKYILPVDADNLISPNFIKLGVEVLESRPAVKVVTPSAQFIGNRSGMWVLPEFSRALLARKNMIDTCAIYAKAEWERVGGYCEEIIAREDWDFWIAVLKEGGEVFRLPEIGLYYRVRKASKRVRDRRLKKHVVGILNKRHPEFFQEELKGPLRYARSWSKLINQIIRLFGSRKLTVNPDYKNLSSFIYSLPDQFDQTGVSIYKGRNELKKYNVEGNDLIVKSYRRPIFINRIIYGFLRASKAERSYEYALKFLNAGIGTPLPIGFITVRRWFLLDKSYFVCLKSACNLQYTDFKKQTFIHQQEILEEIGRTTARMHEQGFLHKDYSAGNILFRDEIPVPVEIIDLNRMRFHPIDMETGCRNFERLPGTPDMFSIMGKAYARERKFDEKKCISLILKFHEC